MAQKSKQSNGNSKKVVIIARPPGSNWARILYGTLAEYDRKTGHAVLTNSRQALYYGQETRGELGLAVNGPKGGSKLGPKLTARLEIPGVTMVAECTPEAVKAWEEPS